MAPPTPLFMAVILLLPVAIITYPVEATRTLSSAPALLQPKPAATTVQFLATHNQARAEVGVPPLTWSANLESIAGRLVRYQRNQKGCAFADLAGVGYGANQGIASFAASPTEVVAMWVEEKRYYSHGNNTCAAGHRCGTYTQVVWRTSREVGCAQAVCAGASSITICLYNPPGNWQGESPY